MPNVTRIERKGRCNNNTVRFLPHLVCACVCVSIYVCVCVCVCAVRPPVTELLPTGLLSDRVLCDDVITDVWSRDPLCRGMRYGLVVLHNMSSINNYSLNTIATRSLPMILLILLQC